MEFGIFAGAWRKDLHERLFVTPHGKIVYLIAFCSCDFKNSGVEGIWGFFITNKFVVAFINLRCMVDLFEMTLLLMYFCPKCILLLLCVFSLILIIWYTFYGLVFSAFWMIIHTGHHPAHSTIGVRGVY